MFSILGNKSRVAGVVPRLPSETGVQGSIPLGWGTCYYFFHCLGWLGIPHRILREMRMQRVPINAIHIEDQSIASLGGLKSKPTI